MWKKHLMPTVWYGGGTVILWAKPTMYLFGGMQK